MVKSTRKTELKTQWSKVQGKQNRQHNGQKYKENRIDNAMVKSTRKAE
jgi:hypothetical protein